MHIKNYLDFETKNMFKNLVRHSSSQTKLLDKDSYAWSFGSGPILD
jgi:hypothetical protein